MTCRYLYSSNAGSAKIPSAFYYDNNGTFRGIVEPEVDLAGSDEWLTMKWWEIGLYSLMQRTDSEVGGS